MSSPSERGSLEAAIRLFHRRWSVPVVAMLHANNGCRFVEMVKNLGTSRDTLSDTLQDLIAKGLVRKNPGYGHPLRPEYILTSSGSSIGEAALPVTEVVGRLDLVRVALKKWPMLVLVAIGRGDDRFNELQAALSGITPRALTVALRELQGQGMVQRTVTDGHPPGTSYALMGRGAESFPVLDRFCVVCASNPRPS